MMMESMKKSSRNSHTSRLSKISLVGVATGIVGGLLLWYGWERRSNALGRTASSIGLSLLAKVLADPEIGGLLGPLQGLLSAPLAEAQKLLA